MQKLFNKILVPVDFSERSKRGVEKSVEIAMEYNCSIHLLHVVTSSPLATVAAAEGHMFIPFGMLENRSELEFQMEKMCRYINVLAGNSILVEYSILTGEWDKAIIDYTILNRIDLVLIGQRGNVLKKRKMLIDPDKIAERTNIPVITVPANRRLIRLYSILIPITDFFPIRKLIYGIYIASKYGTTIKLLGFENSGTRRKLQDFLQKSQGFILDNCNVKVELETITSENIAEAVIDFAELKSVDLVIVNPGTQTKMPGLLSYLFGNIIQKYSSPPVLAVNPR